ncbi:MAG: FAD assembly factor SdhE [Methylomonas sp.]
MSELNKLRWRCRRGTLELDRMLTRYLENRYLAADETERQAFQMLLALEDSELIGYLMGEKPVEILQLAQLVDIIRKRAIEIPAIGS